METIGVEFDKQVSCLRNVMISNLSCADKVYIIPHNDMDFDAIASARATCDICNFFGLKNSIVTNDNPLNMKASLSEIYYDTVRNYNVINTKDFYNSANDKDLCIVVDSSARNRIPVDNIDSYTNTIVIDHHCPDEKIINTDNLFISQEACSASEIMFYLMKSLGIYISVETAQLLMAGIYLDTNELHLVSGSRVFNTVRKLVEYGANIYDVQDLFTISNFEDDRKQKRIINDLVDCTKFHHDEQGKCCAITVNREDPYRLYTDEQLAEACDSLLQYPIEAAFVIGFTDKKDLGSNHNDVISVKARSKKREEDTIDVSEIMQLLDGGGDENRAACKIKASNSLNVKDAIKSIIKNYNIGKEEVKVNVYK